MKMRCHSFLLLIFAYMDKQSIGASFNPYEDYGTRVHGHNHHHGDAARRDDGTKRSLNSEYEDNGYTFLDVKSNAPNINMLERDPQYPYQAVRNYVQNNPVLRDYFLATPPEIGSRIAESTTEEPGENLCRTRSYKLFRPQRLRNVNNVWRTIVNIEKEYEQAVEIRSCARDGMCNGLDSASIPLGYTSYCAQEYISKELVVFNGTTAFDLFRFPSCCVCRLKRS